MVWQELANAFGKALPEEVPIGESFELSACGAESRGVLVPRAGLSDLVHLYGANLRPGGR